MAQFDEILSYLGDFGLYQRLTFSLLCLINVPRAWHHLAQVFLAGSSNYWCASPKLDNVNCTYWKLNETECQQTKRDAAIPVISDLSRSSFPYEGCEKYNLTGVPFYPGINTTDYTNQTLSCDAGWDYDDSQYQSTIITEFNLVCEKEELSHVAQSIYFAGCLVGSVIFGALADWIGRSRSMLIALVVWFVSALGTAFAPDIYTYIAIRFFVAGGSEGTFLAAYIIGTEFVGPSARTITGIFPPFTFALGAMLQAVFAYFCRDWRNLQLILTIPIALFFLYVPFLAESARWLISKGRHEKAEQIIRRVSHVNQVDLPNVLFESSKSKAQQSEEHVSWFVLFATPNMAFKTVVLLWNWCVIGMVYYAIYLNVPNLGSNDYLVFFLTGLIELPAHIYCMWACQHFGGRKINLGIVLIVLGVACLITGFLEPGIAETSVAILGMFTAAASHSIIMIYSVELFPTPVRSAGIGVSYASSRFGCIITPLLYLAGTTWNWTPLPFVVFGPCALSAGLLTFLLPETRGKNLPETLEEGEDFGKPKWMIRSNKDTSHEPNRDNEIVNTVEDKSNRDNGLVNTAIEDETDAAI